jgi:hypothetical protein
VDPQGKHFGTSPPFKLLGLSSVRPYHRTSNGGFRQLRVLGIKDSIIRPLLDLSELAQGISLYLSKQDDPVAIDLLGDIRNSVKYRFFCLPKPWNGDAPDSLFDHHHHQRSEDPSKTQTAAVKVFRACWLTCLLFSVHVSDPQPRSKLFRQRLMPQLQDAICEVNHCTLDENNSNAIHEILLWCTMIGGILSTDVDFVSCRPWYTSHLKRLCLALNISEWTQMVDIMRLFAWIDVACNDPGYTMWIEATQPINK